MGEQSTVHILLTLRLLDKGCIYLLYEATTSSTWDSSFLTEESFGYFVNGVELVLRRHNRRRNTLIVSWMLSDRCKRSLRPRVATSGRSRNRLSTKKANTFSLVRHLSLFKPCDKMKCDAFAALFNRARRWSNGSGC